MADLIDRQAAIDALSHNQEVYTYNFGGDPIDKYTVAIIANDIETVVKLPSAHPEIVRCKDCKHYEIWQLKSDYTDDKRFKPSVCVLGRYAVHRPEDWYCADAERRTDG